MIAMIAMTATEILWWAGGITAWTFAFIAVYSLAQTDKHHKPASATRLIPMAATGIICDSCGKHFARYIIDDLFLVCNECHDPDDEQQHRVEDHERWLMSESADSLFEGRGE